MSYWPIKINKGEFASGRHYHFGLNIEFKCQRKYRLFESYFHFAKEMLSM